MSDLSTVEELTSIMERQAVIIRRLYSIVEQLNATTSIDDEVAALLKESDIKGGGLNAD